MWRSTHSPRTAKTACSAPPRHVTNGDDCYDGNYYARPNQTADFTMHRGDGSFDYNCDGEQTLRESRSHLGVCTCDGAACTIDEGWLGVVPECGASATFGMSGISCAPTPVQKVQACH